MPWVRLDDSFPDHPKVSLLTPAAGWLHVCALCYCNRHLTDGAIPKTIVNRLTSSSAPATAKAVELLVHAKLWIDAGDDWQIHDFNDFQPTREKVLEERDKAAERQRKAREKAMEKRSQAHLRSVDEGFSA